MPNMFGGPQHHPSYDPRTRLEPNQIMVGRTLCTVLPEKRVRYERVDGEDYIQDLGSAPSEVKELARKLDTQAIAERQKKEDLTSSEQPTREQLFSEWQQAVANGDTELGYDDWVGLGTQKEL